MSLCPSVAVTLNKWFPTSELLVLEIIRTPVVLLKVYFENDEELVNE